MWIYPVCDILLSTFIVDISSVWYIIIHLYCGYIQCVICRADSRFASSQWETALLCNDVSHWLGASLESALICYYPPLLWLYPVWYIIIHLYCGYIQCDILLSTFIVAKSSVWYIIIHLYCGYIQCVIYYYPPLLWIYPVCDMLSTFIVDISSVW